MRVLGHRRILGGEEQAGIDDRVVAGAEIAEPRRRPGPRVDEGVVAGTGGDPADDGAVVIDLGHAGAGDRDRKIAKASAQVLNHAAGLIEDLE